MQSLRDLLPPTMLPKKKEHKTNKFWLISEQIATLTNTKPNRWLRLVKTNEHAVLRALDDLKELAARNPAAYFLWLVKKHST